MKIAFRALDAVAYPDDRQFVVSSWSSSFKKSHTAGMIRTEDWAGIMHDQIGKVLALPGARALVAFERADPNYLYGWIAGDTTEPTPIVYYVYVKEPFRRAGIAAALFAAFGVDPARSFTHACSTAVVLQMRKLGKIPGGRFNPLEVRYPKEARRSNRP